MEKNIRYGIFQQENSLLQHTLRTPKDDVDLYIKELREYLNLEEENIEDEQETGSLNIEMKKLVYKHPDLSERKKSFLVLLFAQLFFALIFLVVFSEGITVFYEGGIEILFFYSNLHCLYCNKLFANKSNEKCNYVFFSL